MSSCFVKSVEKLFMTRIKSSAAHTTRMAYVTVGAPPRTHSTSSRAYLEPTWNQYCLIVSIPPVEPSKIVIVGITF